MSDFRLPGIDALLQVAGLLGQGYNPRDNLSSLSHIRKRKIATNADVKKRYPIPNTRATETKIDASNTSKDVLPSDSVPKLKETSLAAASKQQAILAVTSPSGVESRVLAQFLLKTNGLIIFRNSSIQLKDTQTRLRAIDSHESTSQSADTSSSESICDQKLSGKPATSPTKNTLDGGNDGHFKSMQLVFTDGSFLMCENARLEARLPTAPLFGVVYRGFMDDSYRELVLQSDGTAKLDDHTHEALPVAIIQDKGRVLVRIFDGNFFMEFVSYGFMLLQTTPCVDSPWISKEYSDNCNQRVPTP